MEVRSYLFYDSDGVSDDTGLLCEDKSLTVQSERDDADINVIVARFGLTGTMPENVRLPTYEDFTESITDYATALRVIQEADASFMSIPASVRSQFDNDPQKFLEFVSNPANIDKMRELGLAKPKVDPPAPPIPAAPPAPPASSPPIS